MLDLFFGISCCRNIIILFFPIHSFFTNFHNYIDIINYFSLLFYKYFLKSFFWFLCASSNIIIIINYYNYSSHMMHIEICSKYFKSCFWFSYLLKQVYFTKIFFIDVIDWRAFHLTRNIKNQITSFFK